MNIFNNNYICALDIGSSKIAACLAQIKRKRIENIFFESVPSKGIKSGTIINSIELIDSISKLMKNLRAKSGMNVRFIYANISGQDVITKHSHAIVPLAERGNKVITSQDIQKINDQARILGSSLEEEIIFSVPSSYCIDTKANITNPLGLYSHRLEVDLYLVCVKLSHIQSLVRAINQSGYELKDLFFSGIATSRAVFKEELMKGLSLFCDIGSDTTELLVFKNGALCDIEVLAIGGDALTAKIADALNLPLDLAQDIKKSYGIIGDHEQIAQDKEILVKKSSFYKPIKQRTVAQIITAQAKSICSEIKNAVERKVSCREVNDFVAVGRTVLLEGFIETLENTLAIPVRMGRIVNPDIPASIKEDNALSGQKYLMFLTALGILSEAMQDKVSGMPFSRPAKNLFSKTLNKFKELYQEYF